MNAMFCHARKSPPAGGLHRAMVMAEPGEPGGRPERSERGLPDEPPHDKAPARVPEGSTSQVTACKRGEERVERADGARKKRTPPRGKLPLDAVDVDAIRDDQPGITIERVAEPVEQKRDLSSMRRTVDKRETHQSIVVGAIARPLLRGQRSIAKSGKQNRRAA